MLRVHRELVVAGKCLSKSVKRACADIAENNADCADGEFQDRLLVMSVRTMRSGGRIVRPIRKGRLRSEEHTSELQSLMRISYAVFCLKKNKHSTNHADTAPTSIQSAP